ncbi:MAG: hypothetical protein LBT62_00005, partial [Deltaproteobacteria bacterium]|nr:hypothetical protein [Deltaproteobacteria bacterium]
MDFSTLLFLIIGVPLIVVALGIFLLCLRWFFSRDQRANQKKLLETAAKLDEQLINLESRLCALEDILLDPNQPHDP